MCLTTCRPGVFSAGISPQICQELFHNFNVILCLLKVLLPLFFQIFMDGASQRLSCKPVRHLFRFHKPDTESSVNCCFCMIALLVRSRYLRRGDAEKKPGDWRNGRGGNDQWRKRQLPVNRPPHFAELCSKCRDSNNLISNGQYASERKIFLHQLTVLLINPAAMTAELVTVRLGS